MVEGFEVAARFVDAVGERDYAGLAACFAEDARLRALVPNTLRDDAGPAAIAARFRFWYGALTDFELLDSEVDDVGDRLRLRYRVRGVHPEEGPIVQEQQGYAALGDGRIATLNLVCSGFRPA